MKGLLRFVGLVNAALWVGATVFFVLGIMPVAGSEEMIRRLGANHAGYFSTAILNVLVDRFFAWQIAFSVIAALRLLIDWLYLGKYPARLSFSLLAVLFAVGLAGTAVIEPQLKRLHSARYAANATVERREAANVSFGHWQRVAIGLELLLACGTAVYFWRLANPPDPARFTHGPFEKV